MKLWKEYCRRINIIRKAYGTKVIFLIGGLIAFFSGSLADFVFGNSKPFSYFGYLFGFLFWFILIYKHFYGFAVRKLRRKKK